MSGKIRVRVEMDDGIAKMWNRREISAGPSL
jgi:hypothetical protein